MLLIPSRDYVKWKTKKYAVNNPYLWYFVCFHLEGVLRHCVVFMAVAVGRVAGNLGLEMTRTNCMRAVFNLVDHFLAVA